MAAVFADVDLSDHPDAEMIERRLRKASQAHGEPLPPFMLAMSRLMAAGTGPTGTEAARLVGLALRAATRAVRSPWQPDTGADAEDERALRGLCAAIGALMGIAALLTTAAVRASGWRRLPWAVSALLAWLFTTRTVALGALVATVVRAPKDPRPAPEMRTP